MNLLLCGLKLTFSLVEQSRLKCHDQDLTQLNSTSCPRQKEYKLQGKHQGLDSSSRKSRAKIVYCCFSETVEHTMLKLDKDDGWMN